MPGEQEASIGQLDAEARRPERDVLEVGAQQGQLRRRLSLPDGVRTDPPPSNGAGEGAVEHGVDLTDIGGAERLAPVRATALVAIVLGVGPMVDVGLRAAARAAPSELGVEGVEGLTIDAADRRSPSNGRTCSRIRRS